MDVHKEAISIAILNSSGKLVMECVIETKASTILQFFQGLSGSLHVTLEVGTWAAWLYDLLTPHVTELVVCNPRKNALLKQGSKSDRIDARKSAELLRNRALSVVCHGENGLRLLQGLSRSYLTISPDLGRVMNRLKAFYRSWAIPCAGTQVYAPRHRAAWLAKISEAGVRRRAELYCQQLDALRPLHQQARKELLAEGRMHSATKLLSQIPGIGPLRAAQWVALLETPHRFRTQRQLWSYSGLVLETHDGAQYRYAQGQLQRSKKPQPLRGLNTNDNHDLKNIFKGYGHESQHLPRAAPRFLPGLARQRDAAHDGSPHLGAEDCCHQPNSWEERSRFRRPIFETSSLSASDRESVPSLKFILGGGHRVLETLGSRESIHRRSQATVFVETPKSPISPYAPSANQRKSQATSLP
jgi:transposase